MIHVLPRNKQTAQHQQRLQIFNQHVSEQRQATDDHRRRPWCLRAALQRQRRGQAGTLWPAECLTRPGSPAHECTHVTPIPQRGDIRVSSNGSPNRQNTSVLDVLADFYATRQKTASKPLTVKTPNIQTHLPALLPICNHGGAALRHAQRTQ